MDTQTVLTRLTVAQPQLETLGVQSLALFGSVARGEARPTSDVDILVEFARPVGLFEFVRVKHALEAILGCKVDLVTPDALRESMRAAILEELIHVAP